MPYLRNGQVIEQRSFMEELLNLPNQVYALIAFFFATLFNPDAIKQKGAPRRQVRRGGFGGGGGGGGGG
eukprot:CAMPEP_0185360498 /NCGR_PEP_ID=MMETSP1364-20130426/9644_1 /TAXON_ID=38817 /ORGANISM="Gephyrocapsa oceanica, Strain RCC1303" /LENGTH=68 /DNA_ID=CAMNT_0027960759 /DNA_START=60 /DNA_END=263 /DNA_ORIENTATION=-